MESIYYVLCWHCHRRCKHCYEERFHPYVRGELEQVVAEAKANAPRIVANLPEKMTYLDRQSATADAPASNVERVGRIILSGGEVLTDPVREPVLYPTLEAIQEKYRHAGGVKVVIQTTGDLLTPKIIEELLERGVWMISVSGLDDYHVGMEGTGKVDLESQVIGMFEAAGLRASGLESTERNWADEAGPVYSLFGATDDAWIGKIWPRGRAWNNSLSSATLSDNFCNAWSGGLNFMERDYSGSEVSIEPSGDVYPCCIKTAHPLGNLCEEPLEGILDSLAGHPAFEAINSGKPERMGLHYGWDVATFLAQSTTQQPDGTDYANLCIGCDRFHAQVLGPVIETIRNQRRAARNGILARI